MREVRFEVEGEPVAGVLHEPPAAALGQVALVHGFLSRGAEFADAPAALAAKGWRVLSFDQRGFGASGGPRGIVSMARSRADVLGAVAWLRADRPDLPVGLVGHSMGAYFTLEAMAAEPEIRTGVIAAPFRTVRSELGSTEFLGYRLAAAASRAKERIGLGPLVVPYKNRYRDLFLDPEAARRAEQKAFLDATVSLANYESLLAMDGEAAARRVRQPVLVLLAEHDKAVKRESSMAVHDALAGPKEIQRIACGHSMFGDCLAHEAVDHVDQWMRRHLAPV